jgi:hypothetical protein
MRRTYYGFSQQFLVERAKYKAVGAYLQTVFISHYLTAECKYIENNQR